MSTAEPLVLIPGILLIGLGLIYPLIALIRLSQQMNREQLSRRELLFAVALSALIPLTAVLAGFWIVSSRAQASAAFSAALIASALLLLAALIARWRS